MEHFFGSLAYKMRVQHSDFTDVRQPELRRRFPKTFSDLESAQKQNCSGFSRADTWLGILFRKKPLLPSYRGTTAKTMCKLGGKAEVSDAVVGGHSCIGVNICS